MSRQARSSMSVLAALALVALSALPVAAQEPAPRTGGVLKAAMIGEPPTLDMPVTRKELRGFRTAPDLFFWNAWLAAGR